MPNCDCIRDIFDGKLFALGAGAVERKEIIASKGRTRILFTVDPECYNKRLQGL